MADIREQLAAYGARLGVVEPILRGVGYQLDELKSVQAALRANGDYALSDRLRASITEIEMGVTYAFPRFPK